MRLLQIAGGLALLLSAGQAIAATVTLTVQAPASAAAPLSGRVLVFAKALAAGEAKPAEVDAGSFDARETAVAAQQVTGLAPGASVTVDADVQAFPSAFSALKPGRYAVQAVLDQGAPYNYAGRGAGDLVTEVAEVTLPGAGPALHLGAPLPARDPKAPNPRAPEAIKASYPQAAADIRELDFVSPALTRFWGRDTHVRGWVLLPPGYGQGGARFPTVYWTHGYGGGLAGAYDGAVARWRDMKAGAIPPMIWVFLDESGPTGTHEFADSVNNGPWGQALTAELIPQLERTYRMDARRSGRLLTGHSSGGWATLWLQVRYPKLFGGAWPTSPDSSDFHDFTGVDIYRPNADAYRKPDGAPGPLIRDKGRVLATFEDFARLEAVIGPYGGQISSFDWVFSPRGEDGRPQPLFDRATGRIDPAVVAYWRERYDIAHIVERDAARLKPDLDGKVHLIVGTADTFYLDQSARLLEAAMTRAGVRASFRYVPGRTHGDLYGIGADRQGLTKVIAWEMYGVARPGAKPPADLPAVPVT